VNSVNALQLRVNEKLTALPYDTYLKVMCGILRQYSVVYRDELWPESERLLQATADLVGLVMVDSANVAVASIEALGETTLHRIALSAGGNVRELIFGEKR
jgi:hypothetical protein